MAANEDNAWHVMRHVSGLPGVEGRRRLMLVLQAIMDESGNWGENDRDHVFMIAGFISTAEKWQRFSDGWMAAQLPKELKMTCAMKMAANYNEWKYLSPVISLIEDTVMARVECAVHLDSYKRCAKGKIDPYYDSPYFWAFHNAMDRICRTATDLLGYSETVDLFFDVHTLGKRGQKWYELARLIAPDQYRKILPSYIHWEDDEIFLPLKSADLLAGLARRDHSGDVVNLEEVVSRINSIPRVSGSQPLEDDYFNMAINSPPALPKDDDELKEWAEKWKEKL